MVEFGLGHEHIQLYGILKLLPYFYPIFIDIDECDRDPLICGEFATCTNTIGDYNCTCLEGFEYTDNSQRSCKGTFNSVLSKLVFRLIVLYSNHLHIKPGTLLHYLNHLIQESSLIFSFLFHTFGDFDSTRKLIFLS